MNFSCNFTYLVKFWWKSDNVGFKGFMQVLKDLTEFWDYGTLIYEIFVYFY